MRIDSSYQVYSCESKIIFQASDTLYHAWSPSLNRAQKGTVLLVVDEAADMSGTDAGFTNLLWKMALFKPLLNTLLQNRLRKWENWTTIETRTICTVTLIWCRETLRSATSRQQNGWNHVTGSVKKSDKVDWLMLELAKESWGQLRQLEPSYCDHLDPKFVPRILRSYPHFPVPHEMSPLWKVDLRVPGVIGLPNDDQDLHL